MITKEDVVASIKDAKRQMSSEIRFTQDLTNIVYKILYSLFVDNKKYVLLQAPTGTGKSIIGFVVSYCVRELREKEYRYEIRRLNNELSQAKEGTAEYDRLSNKIQIFNDYYEKTRTAYYLTSSKMLQDQIDKDINRFGLGYMFMLKGTDNYKCTLEHERISELNIPNEEKIEQLEKATYKYRPCVGVNLNSEENVDDYPCKNDCPYRCARNKAKASEVAVFNYHYFATVLNSAVRVFDTRFLTIADEAHKLSEVIDAMFTCTINLNLIDDIEKIIKKLEDIRILSVETYPDINKVKKDCTMVKTTMPTYNDKDLIFSFIRTYSITVGEDIKPFIDEMLKKLGSDKNKASISTLIQKVSSIKDRVDNLADTLFYYDMALSERYMDIFTKVDKVSKDAKYSYIEIKDLNETNMLQNKFVKHCNRIMFMSATMGDLTEFATIYGLKPSDCAAYSIPSTFDFSKSPIFLCDAGNLRRKDYANTIDKCIETTMEIMRMHKNEKGIVHTHTFGITKALQEAVMSDYDLLDRCLFYTNANEKREAMMKMYNDKSKPWVICGPSLVEGIDLKYDMGRFNILVKVPYPPITDYARAKMNYCSFWYDRTTKQTIVQAIGRTNRAKDDASIIYLIDSCFVTFIKKIDDEGILSRLKRTKIVLKNQREEQLFDIDDVANQKKVNNIVNSIGMFGFGTEDDLPF